MVEPYHPLYNNHLCVSDTGIADVKSNEPFHRLVANFGDHVMDLLPHQVVTYSLDHPETLVESEIAHDEMFGLIPDDVDTKFRKRHVEAKDIDTINRQLAYKREIHMGKDEMPVTANKISLGIPPDKEEVPCSGSMNTCGPANLGK